MPSATAPVLQPYGSTRKAENAYPRPRDRRLSLKTRAAVGKPPGSVKAKFAVSSADKPDQLPSKSTLGNSREDCCRCKPPKVGAASVSSISHWLSQPGAEAAARAVVSRLLLQHTRRFPCATQFCGHLAPEGQGNYRDHIIARGDTGSAGLRRKALWVLGEVERRMAAFGLI